MQNNLMKVDNDFQEENEISIYDIVNIFLKKNKGPFEPLYLFIRVQA